MKHSSVEIFQAILLNNKVCFWIDDLTKNFAVKLVGPIVMGRPTKNNKRLSHVSIPN